MEEAKSLFDEEVEPEVEPEAEEPNEEEPEGVAEEETEEEEPKEDERYINVRNALHEERSRRRETERSVRELQEKLTSYKSQTEDWDGKLSGLRKQIKELGLEDTIKIPDDPPPEIKKLRERERQEEQAQKQNQLMNDLRTEVRSRVGEFKNIDVKNEDQGITLTSMILASLSTGLSVEEATQESLDRLNRMVGKKTVPIKTTKKVQKSAPRQSTNSAVMKLRETAMKSGKSDDWDRYFESLEE